MHFALGHVHEDRQVAVGIEADMQLDGSLFLTKFCPRKGGETEIDDSGGIKQIELAFEREFVCWSHQSATMQQSVEQRLIERGRLFGVDSCQGCLGGSLHAEVIESFVLGLKIVGDIPKASLPASWPISMARNWLQRL